VKWKARIREGQARRSPLKNDRSGIAGVLWSQSQTHCQEHSRLVYWKNTQKDYSQTTRESHKITIWQGPS